MRSVVNSCLVAFVLPSSGLTLAIYYTLYGLCKIKPLDGGTCGIQSNYKNNVYLFFWINTAQIQQVGRIFDKPILEVILNFEEETQFFQALEMQTSNFLYFGLQILNQSLPIPPRSDEESNCGKKSKSKGREGHNPINQNIIFNGRYVI